MNPHPALRRIGFECPQALAQLCEAVLGEGVLAFACFEIAPDSPQWRVELLLPDDADINEMKAQLFLAAQLAGINIQELQLQEEWVQPQDWQSYTARQFPPLRIGRFYVHGAHVAEPPPISALALQVDAGAAFGSGEHATTAGCMRALQWIGKRLPPPRAVLDMGCGSAVLAMAAAKLFPAARQIVAADVDPIAVRVARENVRINRLPYINAVQSDGYHAAQVRRNAPYQVILSNILARPLIRFAPHLASHLAPGGVAILSGLLRSQAGAVYHAHKMQGLRLVKRFEEGEWVTLLLRRPYEEIK